ncbi:MAG TPA: hypothetical protein DIT50_00395 [Rhodocyclaceae bacterium]|nr:hypothetical protein [Rhodocyclaceae bacterium]
MRMDYWWLAYPVLGVFVGLFAGLLGVGGGAIMVPVLTTLFAYQGFSSDVVVHMALGSSMAGIVLTSFASARTHYQHHAVRTDALVPMASGVLFGTFVASFIASLIPSRTLAIFFACFIAYVSLQMFLNLKPKPTRQLPGWLGLGFAGFVIGAVSALVAIGGGTLTVPFLTWCNVPVAHAIGTSAALGIPISITGTIGYVVNGWHDPNLPPFSLGYVYLPAVIGVSATSILTAPIGARWAHRLPVPVLKRILAGVLLLLLAKMLWTLYGGGA